MLALKNIHFQPATAEEPILKGVNLHAQFGVPTIIEGESGSGKTSLIDVISGLSKPQKGEIYWKNKKLDARQRKWICGIVFQFPERHFLGLTVAQELRLGHLRPNREAQSIALGKVGLSKVNLKMEPERLSGGQQRRLAIAVQLLRNPAILLLDEPTAGLDWSVRDEIIELLFKLSKEKLLIVVTHETELFKNFLTYSYRLNNGQLHES
tara:strand:- start:245 stop:871 length:627 start_codon:yes stop_codon:yes gene_type:complete